MWTLFGVVHTKFKGCSTRARMLNCTSLLPSTGGAFLNGDSIKPGINQQEQTVWKIPLPPVKTGAPPQIVEILARRPVEPRKRCTFLYSCEWEDDTWSWESSKALDEDPVYLEFLQLHSESICRIHLSPAELQSIRLCGQHKRQGKQERRQRSPKVCPSERRLPG